MDASQPPIPSPAASGGPVQPARPRLSSRLLRRRLADRAAKWIVVGGGLTIIASILAILFVIFGETVPLFQDPSIRPAAAAAIALEGPPLALDVDEYRELACVATAKGVRFFAIQDDRGVKVPAPLVVEGATVTSVSSGMRGTWALGLSDGRVQAVDVRFSSVFGKDTRVVSGNLEAAAPGVLDPEKRPVRVLTRVAGEKGGYIAGAVGPRDLLFLRRTIKKSLIGGESVQESRSSLALPIQGEIRSLVGDLRGDDLYAGTSDGRIVRIDLRKPAEPRIVGTHPAAGPDTSIDVLGFLLGDRTLVAGDAKGGVSTWQLARPGEGEFVLTRMTDFAPHGKGVRGFSSSMRDKGFLTLDVEGNLALRYGTTGATLLRASVEGAQAAVMAPKSNGLLALDAAGKVSSWEIHNPHPEITLKALFGATWYEGYEKPAYVWQSTGGTDDFEAKLCLTPLIYGTLKGTFYALIFAVPLALLSALYVSQFMHPALKAYIKPAVEVMAALPSVVLGFIAGLWLAPRVERVVPGLFLLPVVAAVLILAATVAWRRVPPATRKRFPFGTEVFLLIPVVLIAGALSFGLGAWLEAGALGGDYRTWLLRALGLTFDQRNSLVVGLAMGFAVVPIIFTIAEDSLSNVPGHLGAGSLALGASRWQTAIGVVLPTASPGIFSAVMVGFGRAVGETMIVLMATGNTPVMNASIFSGFRALSANIAVELPDAAEKGTLFRVLFLAAFLLFCMTFVLNTAAELIRLRLRKKFQGL